MNSNPTPENGPRDGKLQSGGVTWPVTHPMLRNIDGQWCQRDGDDYGVYVPNDLADELNRWATVQACARMASDTTRYDTAIVGYIARVDDDDLLDLHARLTQETAR